MDSMAPKVINGGGVRQGITSLQANTWHHLVVSYPGAASDINATRLYVDGRRVDASISSVDGVVLTSSGIDLRLGRPMMIPSPCQAKWMK